MPHLAKGNPGVLNFPLMPCRIDEFVRVLDLGFKASLSCLSDTSCPRSMTFPKKFLIFYWAKLVYGPANGIVFKLVAFVDRRGVYNVAYFTAFRSLPLGVGVLHQLLEVFDGLLCLSIWSWASFLALSASRPSCPAKALRFFWCLSTMSSIYGMFHHFQVSDSTTKYRATRLARIVCDDTTCCQTRREGKERVDRSPRTLYHRARGIRCKRRITFAGKICSGNARSDSGGEFYLHINHGDRIGGWFHQCGACASVGFGQYELAADIKDLVLSQELLASHDSHAHNGMKSATAADESLRKGANPQNDRYILLSFVANSKAFNGGPQDGIDIHNLILDASPKACQRLVADVLQLLQLGRQCGPSGGTQSSEVLRATKEGSEGRPQYYPSISFLSERSIRGGDNL